MIRRLILLAVVLAALAGGGWMAWRQNDAQNQWVRVTEYTVTHQQIPAGMDGYKLLYITDLHNAPFAGQICRIIQGYAPDCILLGGDLVQLPDVDPETDMEQVWAILDRYADEIPTYFVSGNHETGTEYYYLIYQALKDHGAVSLEDKANRLWKGDSWVRIVGLGDPGPDVLDQEDRQRMRQTLQDLLAEDEEAYTILLCHRSNAYAFLQDLPADLMLSGHMHGGVVRLPLVGGVFGNDDERLFPRYDYGVFQESDMTLIVSGGCDKNPAKRRFWNPPEVVLVTLRQG